MNELYQITIDSIHIHNRQGRSFGYHVVCESNPILHPPSFFLDLFFSSIDISQEARWAVLPQQQADSLAGLYHFPMRHRGGSSKLAGSVLSPCMCWYREGRSPPVFLLGIAWSWCLRPDWWEMGRESRRSVLFGGLCCEHGGEGCLKGNGPVLSFVYIMAYIHTYIHMFFLFCEEIITSTGCKVFTEYWGYLLLLCLSLY